MGKMKLIFAISMLFVAVIISGCVNSKKDTVVIKERILEIPIVEEEVEEKLINKESKFGEKVCIGGKLYLILNRPEIYISKDEYTQPEEGYQFVTIEMEYINEETEETDISPQDNLTVKDLEGHSYSPKYSSARSPELEDSSLVLPGDSIKGYITIEVPKGVDITKAIYSNDSSTTVIK